MPMVLAITSARLSPAPAKPVSCPGALQAQVQGEQHERRHQRHRPDRQPVQAAQAINGHQRHQHAAPDAVQPGRRDNAPGALQCAGHRAAEDIRGGGVEAQQGHRHGQVDQLGAVATEGKLQHHVGAQASPHAHQRRQRAEHPEQPAHTDEHRQRGGKADFLGHVRAQPEHRQGHADAQGNQRQPDPGDGFGLGDGPSIVALGNHFFIAAHARL